VSHGPVRIFPTALSVAKRRYGSVLPRDIGLAGRVQELAEESCVYREIFAGSRHGCIARRKVGQPAARYLIKGACGVTAFGEGNAAF